MAIFFYLSQIDKSGNVLISSSRECFDHRAICVYARNSPSFDFHARRSTTEKNNHLTVLATLLSYCTVYSPS